MGKIVEWIRLSEYQGWFQYSIVMTTAFLVSCFLLLTVVLSPLFVYGYKEFIRQQERFRYDRQLSDLVDMASEGNRIHFLQGRLNPLSKLNMKLTSSARRQMIQDLESSLQDARNKTDRELMMAAALKFDNFFERYHFTVSSRSQSRFWRFFGR